MNILNKVALQGLLKSRTRTIVTIIGVILSAAMFTAVTTFGVSLLGYMCDGSMMKYGRWHVGFSDVTTGFMEKQISSANSKSSIHMENIGYSPLPGSINPDKPYLFLMGFDDETRECLPINIISGRLPENENEIAISGRIATNGGVDYIIGDTLTLSVGQRILNGAVLTQHNMFNAEENFIPKQDMTFTVVGIYQRPGFEEFSAPGYTVITKTDLKTADSYMFLVELQNPYSIKSFIRKTGRTDTYLNDNVLRFYGLSDDTLFTTLLYTTGAIVICIIMFGSVFLIYNAFSISLNERTQQFGILASVGATPKQLRNSVLFEGLCIGIIGIPIGIIIGLFSIWGVLLMVARKFESILYAGISLELRISTVAILLAVLVSFITILISAYIPAKKAASTPVMDCIRQTNEVKLSEKDVKINRLQQMLYGFEGALALKNFKRNKKRYRSIVLSLILSIVLFICTGSFVTYLQQGSGFATEFTTYDISLSLPSLDDSKMDQLFIGLKTVSGITDSMYLSEYSMTGNLDASFISNGCRQTLNSTQKEGPCQVPLNVQFVDDSTYEELLELAGVDKNVYINQDKKFIAVGKLNNTEGVMQEAEEFNDMFTSSSIDMKLTVDTVPDWEKDITVDFVEVVPHDLPVQQSSYELLPYFFTIMVPYSQKNSLTPEDFAPYCKGITFCSDTPTASTDQIEKLLQAGDITNDYLLFNCYHMMDENRNTVFICNVFAYSFIVMISMIAIANVFNTVSTNIRMRRRELAMLRSVGMSNHDFQKMMNFECAFYGIRTLVFGLPLAIVLSVTIYQLMYLGGTPDIAFAFPWKESIISVVGVLFAIFITMLYSVSEIKRENIIDALRDDAN